MQRYTIFQKLSSSFFFALSNRCAVPAFPLTGWRLGEGGGTPSVIRTTNGQISHKRLLEVTPPLAPNRLLAAGILTITPLFHARLSTCLLPQLQ